MKIVIGIIISSLAVIVVLSYKNLHNMDPLKTAQKLESTGFNNPRRKGAEEAQHNVIEYMDFQCPACIRGARILNQFLQDHPSVLSLDMKYFPLSNEGSGFLAALYAECASRQGQFWPMYDKLIEMFDQWRRLRDPSPAFDLYAKEIELDLKIIEQCVQQDETQQTIRDDKMDGQLLGIRSTPTYIIDDQMVVGTKLMEDFLNNVMLKARDEE
jgi:protein-disulfide isomerase